MYLKAEEKDIELRVECPNDIILNHDRKWTSEAIFNVLENAVKYTDNGGKIHLTVEKMGLFTKIDIKDTGIGIKQEELNKVFRRFFRSSSVSETEGVGIGLYLANEIITKQGGYMKVSSKKDKGSIFSIFLYN